MSSSSSDSSSEEEDSEQENEDEDASSEDEEKEEEIIDTETEEGILMPSLIYFLFDCIYFTMQNFSQRDDFAYLGYLFPHLYTMKK